jgi:hypothetical protein
MAHAPAIEDAAATRATARRTRWRRVRAALLARPGLDRLGVIAALFEIWEIAARFFVDKMFSRRPHAFFVDLHGVPDPACQRRCSLPSSSCSSPHAVGRSG